MRFEVGRVYQVQRDVFECGVPVLLEGEYVRVLDEIMGVVKVEAVSLTYWDRELVFTAEKLAGAL